MQELRKLVHKVRHFRKREQQAQRLGGWTGLA